MPLGEWFKMSRPQRIASMVIVVIIVAITALRILLPRNKPLPAQVEQRAIELAKFRHTIDTTAIDTVPRRRKKAPRQSTATPPREIEEIPTY